MSRFPRRFAGLAAVTALALVPLAGQTATAKTGPAQQRTPAPATSSATAATAAVAQTNGMDVSSHQGNVDWASWWGQGMKFAYVKATEGTTYKNPYFAQQYNGSYNVGMIRGAYHFGLPARLDGDGPGRLVRQQRRRVVARRQDAAGRARHRVQPLRSHLLRADAGRHAEPGSRRSPPDTRRAPDATP